MPFTPKDWRNWPDTTTPLTATALEDLEARLAAYSDTQPGPSGPSGAAGAPGATGPTGPSGAAGSAGASGPSGADSTVPGPTGPTGVTGATGPAGSAGAVGATGVTGATGPAGATGPTGVTGAAGPSGPSGPSGPAGIAGATGPSGPTGLTGPTGPTGVTGATGAAGASGTPGTAGVTGPSGPSGPAGGGSGTLTFDYGPPTDPGSSGDYYIEIDGTPLFDIWTYDGTDWVDSGISFIAFPVPPGGSTGEVLAKVDADDWNLEWVAAGGGPSGPAGATGATGPSGPTGLTGATGPSGVTGAAGPSGPSGPAGIAGATGPSGPTGLTGATGPTGVTGATGATGATGPIVDATNLSDTSISVNSTSAQTIATFIPNTALSSGKAIETEVKGYLINNSGAARTYVFTLIVGGVTYLTYTDGATLTNSATNFSIVEISAAIVTHSSGSAYLQMSINRYAPTAANARQAIATTTLGAIYALTTNDLTGTPTIQITCHGQNTTATQTFRRRFQKSIVI